MQFHISFPRLAVRCLFQIYYSFMFSTSYGFALKCILLMFGIFGLTKTGQHLDNKDQSILLRCDDVWHDVENRVISKPSHTSATGNNTMAQGPSSPQREHVCCAYGVAYEPSPFNNSSREKPLQFPLTHNSLYNRCHRGQTPQKVKEQPVVKKTLQEIKHTKEIKQLLRMYAKR